MWIPELACTRCARRLVADGDESHCGACGQRYGWHDRIFRTLSSETLARFDPFVRQYRIVREQDGYRARDSSYYRRLPRVAADDPRASEWRLRRESFERFRHQVLAPDRGRALWILDLGAGSGWLSHQLTSIGQRLVAVDPFDDELDGLGACRHYPAPFAMVQAEFDALPFDEAMCDVAVFNASLHYSPDPGRTLFEARRVLASGGAIVVMDSPMFTRAEDGEAMVRAQAETFADQYGVVDAMRPGIGYLTWDALDAMARRLGLRGRFFPTRGPLAWRARREWARLRLGRQPSAFGVWIAR